MKREVLNWYADGKDLEVRIALPVFLVVRVGWKVFVRNPSSVAILREVRKIRKYRNFDDLAANEDPSRICPGMTEKQALVRGLRHVWPISEERKGVLVFELVRC